MCDLCDKTVFSGGRASLLPPAPFLSKRRDTHGATRLLGPRRTLYGRKSTTFSANGQKISLLFPSSARKTAFSTFEPHYSVTFSGSSPDSHCGHTSYYRNIAPHPRESPQSSTRIRSGGGRRWRTCIKRWNVATLSPRRRGDTARPTQGDRRKPRERRRNPRNRRVGGTGNPQSSTRIRSGGGRRWSTCIRRWNVATLSPRRRGDTARPTQGDRRKPRERRRNPRSRRVGGTGKPQSSTRIRSGGGRRWSACIKRWNVATLSPRRRGDTAQPTSTQPEESAGRLPG